MTWEDHVSKRRYARPVLPILAICVFVVSTPSYARKGFKPAMPGVPALSVTRRVLGAPWRSGRGSQSSNDGPEASLWL